MIDMKRFHAPSPGQGNLWKVYFLISSNGDREYKYEPTQGWEHAFVGSKEEVKAYIASLPKK